MSCARRLADIDVETIFSCIHLNKLPPTALTFRIVFVGSDGLRLSPPSYNFDNGLYILIKPEKKSNSNASPSSEKVPSNLRHLVMHEPPMKGRHWTLSGPQFPRPTKIQQRYCYPKGDDKYSSQRGGALWTMFTRNGQEDLEFRLLHVYYSPKRAVNQYKKTSYEPIYHEMKRHKPSTMKVESLSSMSSLSSSPVPPFSPCILPSSSKWWEELFNQAATSEIDYDMGFPHLRDDQTLLTFSNSFNEDFAENHKRFRDEISPRNFKSPLTPAQVSTEGSVRSYTPNRIFLSNSSVESMQEDVLDSGEVDIHPSLIEFKTCWLEPIPLENKNSLDNAKTSTPEQRVKNFAATLDIIHNDMKERIEKSPQSEQAFFLSLLSSWAKRMAQDPLNLNWKINVEHDDDSDIAAV